MKRNPFLEYEKKMTIQQWFTSDKVDLDFLDDLADDSDYWRSCYKFVYENWDKEVSELSEKQGAWASKILDDCVEKRIEGRR